MKIKKEMIKIKNMQRFFFEANQLFDWIDSSGDLERLQEIYPEFREARSNPSTSRIEFGFRREHTGDDTLGEFLEKYDI